MKKFSAHKTKNRFSKSESEIEIQNFLKPKTENRLSKFYFLKTKPEFEMQNFPKPKSTIDFRNPNPKSKNIN